MRRGDIPPQSVIPNHPGGLNPTARPPPFHEMYTHSTSGPPFPNNTLMRPPPAMIAPPDANPIHLSPTEIYRKTHEVTATVCIPLFFKYFGD